MPYVSDAQRKFFHSSGAMTQAAKREGVSNSKYIQEHEHSKGKAGQRARFAKIMSHLRNK